MNKYHEPTREKKKKKKQIEVLRQGKENLCKLKDRIFTNIKENIKDQCGDNTYYSCWSALGLGDKSSIEKRITKLKDLLAILCTNKVHVVKMHTSKKEDQVEPNLWNRYKVRLEFRFIFLRILVD